MRLDGERESTNFEVQRGGGRGFGGLPLSGGRLGLGGLVLVVIAGLVFGVNPLQLLDGGASGPAGPDVSVSRDAAGLSDVQHWSLRVLGSTERVWGDLFQRQGRTYTPTTLVFYTQSGLSGCGAAQAAMGPFYCPNDQKVYLDTDFFEELTRRFGAPGDFAQAYVVGHEVGHHVQDLLGILGRVNGEQRRVSEAAANALQVRVELQADCFAGVWARGTNLMEPGDVEEGLTAARAIGDDTLQKAAGQRPVPESFTHGSAAQRSAWLKRGLETGDPAQCDTFAPGADA